MVFLLPRITCTLSPQMTNGIHFSRFTLEVWKSCWGTRKVKSPVGLRRPLPLLLTMDLPLPDPIWPCPAVAAWPGNLLGMQNLRLQLRPTALGSKLAKSHVTVTHTEVWEVLIYKAPRIMPDVRWASIHFVSPLSSFSVFNVSIRGIVAATWVAGDGEQMPTPSTQ